MCGIQRDVKKITLNKINLRKIKSLLKWLNNCYNRHVQLIIYQLEKHQSCFQTRTPPQFFLIPLLQNTEKKIFEYTISSFIISLSIFYILLVISVALSIT